MRPFLRFDPPPPPRLMELPAFRLVDQQGRTFERDALAGQVWIVDFIFTRCTSVCPLLTGAMGRLARRLDEEGVDEVRLLSVTVDPEYDTPEVLRSYAAERGADPHRWTWLTGEPAAIEELVGAGFKLALGEPSEGPAQPLEIAHSGKLALVDGDGFVRGYYDTDEAGLDEVFHRSLHVLRQQRR